MLTPSVGVQDLNEEHVAQNWNRNSQSGNSKLTQFLLNFKVFYMNSSPEHRWLSMVIIYPCCAEETIPRSSSYKVTMFYFFSFFQFLLFFYSHVHTLFGSSDSLCPEESEQSPESLPYEGGLHN
jgi:hypothetical protein